MLNLQGIYDENGDLISKRATTPSENEEDPAVKGMDDDQKYDFYSKRKLVLEAEVEQIRAGLAAEEQAEEEQRILWGTSSYGRYTDGGQANEAHKSDTFHSANLPDDHNDLTGTLYQEKADNEKLMERPMNSRTASIDENYDDFEGAEDDVEEQGRETQKGSNENLKISRSTSFGDDFVKFDDMNENNAADEENEEDGENFAGAEESKPEVDEGCVHKVRTGVEEAQSGEAGLDKADESEPNDDEADGSEPEDESLDEGEEGGYEDEDATEEEGYEDEEEVGEGEYEDEDETEVEEDGDPHDEDADKTLVGLPSPKGPVSAFQPINGSGYKAGFFTPKKTHRDPSNKEISDKLSELKDGKLGMLD
ncbi:MAG: hypothetical protein M1830_006677 [Pleopsidium flavum]|nr:MAG: hypothetical protein M1830_006677 [Pleopsidium flavum]